MFLIVYVALGVAIMHADLGMVPSTESHGPAMSTPASLLTVTAGSQAPHVPPLDPKPCETGGQVCMSNLPPPSPAGWLDE